MHVSIVHDCVRGRLVRGCGRALSITVVSEMSFMAAFRSQPFPPPAQSCVAIPWQYTVRYHRSRPFRYAFPLLLKLIHMRASCAAVHVDRGR
jgi:hypothetical protein